MASEMYSGVPNRVFWETDSRHSTLGKYDIRVLSDVLRAGEVTLSALG